MSRGFTLIELLVTIAIIAILATLSVGGINNYLKESEKTSEVHAARALMAGFHAYAADNSGRLMAGYDLNASGVVDEKGEPIKMGAAKARYAWRIAPYIDYNIDKILLVNNSKMAPKTDPMYQYLVSVFTPFGMNINFVGGNFNGSYNPDNIKAINRWGNFCVRNIVHVNSPSKLIVFASVYSTHMGRQKGCWEVDPPSLPINQLGFVDYRFNNKAIIANFDGHVELATENELKDMRRWSNLASIENNPNWKFK